MLFCWASEIAWAFAAAARTGLPPGVASPDPDPEAGGGVDEFESVCGVLASVGVLSSDEFCLLSNLVEGGFLPIPPVPVPVTPRPRPARLVLSFRLLVLAFRPRRFGLEEVVAP